MFLALISRCKDEPYVAEFVRYYLSQGVDMIYLLDDGSDQAIYRDVLQNPKVTIVPGKNIVVGHNGLRAFYPTIRHQYEWLIHVDMDEYIATRKRAQATIRHELETTFKDVHWVFVPWVFMSCNSLEKNPACLLQTNVYRPDYDKPHPPSSKGKFKHQRLCKSIFRPAFFNGIMPHNPIEPVGKVTMVRSAKRAMTEEVIRTAHLVCYHYRYVSIEQFLHKTKTNRFYKQHADDVRLMLEHDHPDLVDETMRNKSLQILN
jgi:hypothetical protein